MVRICWDFGHRRSFQGPLAGFEAEGSQPASQPFWISLNSGFLDFDAEREQEWSPYVIEWSRSYTEFVTEFRRGGRRQWVSRSAARPVTYVVPGYFWRNYYVLSDGLSSRCGNLGARRRGVDSWFAHLLDLLRCSQVRQRSERRTCQRRCRNTQCAVPWTLWICTKSATVRRLPATSRRYEYSHFVARSLATKLLTFSSLFPFEKHWTK